MITAGILAEDDRVELIEGEIVCMSPIGTRHSACIDRLTMLFARRLGRRAIVRVQSPITLDDQSEPQPDVTVLKPRDDFYATRHPGPKDVLLLVEVADSSLEYDRGVKVPLYARAGIQEVWTVDVIQRSIEVSRRPTLRGYRERHEPSRRDTLAPVAFPRTAFRVSDILG
jgi:Uma2 family endonuclease